MDKLREEADHKLRNSQIVVSKMSEEKMRVEEKCKEESSELQTRITNLLDTIYEHKEHIQNSLKFLQGKYEDVVSSTDSLLLD